MYRPHGAVVGVVVRVVRDEGIAEPQRAHLRHLPELPESEAARAAGAADLNAANRLDPATADNGGESAVLRIFERLAALVPEIRNPVLLVADAFVRRAIEESQKQLMMKGPPTTGALRAELARGILEVAKTVYDIANDVGNAAYA